MNTNNDSVTERFRALRERAGLSMDELAKAMGYKGASSIQRYENAHEFTKKFLSVELTGKLVKAIKGKGTPPIQAGEVWDLAGSRQGFVSTFDPDHYEEPREETEASLGVFTREHWHPTVSGAIPEIDAKLGAGLGAVGDVINLPTGGIMSGHRVLNEWLIPADYLRNEAKASPNFTIITEIIGDSMYPTYAPGDRVIVDLSQNRLVSDTVYAISDGHTEPQIKRLQRIPFSEPPQVRIISDNPSLETFTVELERLTIIGRICGHIARK